DNGTEKFDDKGGGAAAARQWALVQFGDGGFVRVDPTNTQIVYHTFFFTSNFIERSNDGGTTWTDIAGGINTSDPANFYVPYVIDPTNHNRLLLGTDQLYVTTDGGGNAGGDWTLLGSALPSTASGIHVNSIAVDPNNGSHIYVAAGAQLFVTSNNGTNWTDIT